MEPGQEEVEAGTLVGLLAHACGRHCAEGPDKVSLDSGRWLKGEDPGGPQEVDRHLQK